MNHLIANFKLTNIMTEKRDCGSGSSNWKGKDRKMAEGNADSSDEEYVYPFADDSCHWIY